MAIKVTTGRPLFEPDFVNYISIWRSESLQFVYRLVGPFQKLVQRGGIYISRAGVRRMRPGLFGFIRAITVAEIPARNQKDRQHNQHAERVVLPGPAGMRPEDDIFYSDQNRFHMVH